MKKMQCGNDSDLNIDDIDFSEEQPLIADYFITKRSIHKINGQLFLQIETGHPINSFDDDGDLEDSSRHPISKLEAIGLMRESMIVDNETVNRVIGENVDRVIVSDEISNSVLELQ